MKNNQDGESMERNYIKEYFETYYQTEREKFLDKITEYMIQNRDELIKEIYDVFEKFVVAVGKGQEEYPSLVECIQISLLRISLYQEKPMFRFDAYGEMGVLGLGLFCQNVPFQWLTDDWREFKERLRDCVVEMKATRYISEARIQQMMLESIEMIEDTLYGILKYPFFELDQSQGLLDVTKTEHFYISFGSYMDKQRILATDFKEIDIFLHEKNETLNHRKYRKKIYNKKEFKDLELFHSQFEECQFINCVFQNTNLRDVVFENCRFYQVEFQDCLGEGMTIHNSMLDSVRFEGTTFYYQGEGNGSLQGIYKPLDIMQSQIDNMEMRNCDVRYARFTDNDYEDFKVIKCKTEQSTMEGKLDEDGVFQTMPAQEDE